MSLAPADPTYCMASGPESTDFSSGVDVGDMAPGCHPRPGATDRNEGDAMTRTERDDAIAVAVGTITGVAVGTGLGVVAGIIAGCVALVATMSILAWL